MINHKVFIPALIVTAIASGLFMKTSLVNADDNSVGPQSLITRLAQKFNLKESDVKAVFDEERSNRQAQRKQAIEDKLSQAATAGTITETQKSAILTKLSEMQASRPEPGTMQGMTKEERQTQRDARRSEMDTWLKDNGLTWETYQSVIGREGHGYGGPRRGNVTSE